MSTADEMMTAVKAGDMARMNELLTADPALVNARDAEGNSALLIASYWGKHDVAQALLARQPELSVFEAAAAGQLDRVREWVKADPSLVRAWSHDGFTPLHLAAFFGHEAVAQVLLAHGAEVSIPARNAMRVQPLHSAAAGDHLAICRELIARGADVNARQEGGFTPLMSAAQNGSVELIQLLLAHGADPRATTAAGKTARDLAVESGHDAVAALL